MWWKRESGSGKEVESSERVHKVHGTDHMDLAKSMRSIQLANMIKGILWPNNTFDLCVAKIRSQDSWAWP